MQAVKFTKQEWTCGNCGTVNITEVNKPDVVECKRCKVNCLAYQVEFRQV